MNAEVVSADEVLASEYARVQRRRVEINRPSSKDEWHENYAVEEEPDNLVGLALSGGGVRSATFNLGFLQGLQTQDHLKMFDYLSTVSGGGYIGACLTWFMSVQKKGFPFSTNDDHSTASSDVLSWLRSHGNYLAPRRGLNHWTLFSSALGGSILNLLVLLPLFFLAVFFLAQPLPFGEPPLLNMFVSALPELQKKSGFSWMLFGGVIAIILFMLSTIVVTITNSAAGLGWRNEKLETNIHIWSARALMAGMILVIVAVAIGTTPIVYELLKNEFGEWVKEVIASQGLSGIIALIGATFGKKSGGEIGLVRTLFLYVGLLIIGYTLLLFAYAVSSESATIPTWLALLLCFSVPMSVLTNVNYSSMHRYYRNRLMEAYMPVKESGKSREWDSDCRLSDIPQTMAPYHIINTNVVTHGSDDFKLRSRKGDNFILSPLFCGSGATGYVKTKDLAGGDMTLATAFAISGAAVDPNYFFSNNRALSFLMSLFNTRLGYWIRNPRRPTHFGALARPWWYLYMFRELFSGKVNEQQGYVYLSDGGHFENLGVYELIRRKCRTIVVVDAGADPCFTFRDLGQMIQLVRTDFGANIVIENQSLVPLPNSRGSFFAERAYSIGKIYYADNTEGLLILVKPTLVDGLTKDIMAYAAGHPTFPDEPTSDQFFDEQQFEAYRELGYQIGVMLTEDRAMVTEVWRGMS